MTMMSGPGSLPPGALEAVRALLASMGLRPDQVWGPMPPVRAMPTFDEYLDRVAQAVGAGTRKVYDSYWQRVRRVWGQRRLDEPTPLEITQLAERVKAEAVVRRNSRGGRTAAEHLIAALRCVYRFAVADGLVAEAANPAARVAKPRRLASVRHALSPAQLAEINRVVAGTGGDPDLDSLLIRLHTETACRRGGALALRIDDLDARQCLIRLREKGDTIRWQPVSPTLMRLLLDHHDRRGGGLGPGLLRYRDGRPITARRYDHLWHRVGRHLPWVATQQISTHWLRHTTLTWVERACGYAVARAYAGHRGRADAGTTVTYVRANLTEVADALTALTGEPHPLATHTVAAAATVGEPPEAAGR